MVCVYLKTLSNTRVQSLIEPSPQVHLYTRIAPLHEFSLIKLRSTFNTTIANTTTNNNNI